MKSNQMHYSPVLCVKRKVKLFDIFLVDVMQS